MPMKKLFALLLIAFSVLFVVFPAVADAAPKLKANQKIKVSTYKNTKQINITFSNLASASKITYELTYKRKGGQDGAGGSVIPTKKQKSVTKTLLFGTCSARVCTYHKNVSNIKLKVKVWYYPSLVIQTYNYNIK